MGGRLGPTVYTHTHTHTHTHSESCLSSIFTVTHSSISVGRLPRWHRAVDFIFFMKLVPLKSLSSSSRKPGESPRLTQPVFLFGGWTWSPVHHDSPHFWPRTSALVWTMSTIFFLTEILSLLSPFPSFSGLQNCFLFLRERPDFVVPLLKILPWFLNTQGEPEATVLCIIKLWTIDILNLNL